MLQYLKNFSGDFIAKFIVWLAEKAKINLMVLGHRYEGIGKSHSYGASGEKFLIENILPIVLKQETNPTFFDVGANKGTYSDLLAGRFMHSTIYTFEPNPETYSVLKKNLIHDHIRVYNLGLGNITMSDFIYTSKSNITSVNASSDLNVLRHVVKDEDDIIKFKIDIVPLDKFCNEHNIKKINFLKIDTEGFEMEVLKGAENMLKNDCIDLIQFEFNETHIYRRIFLKDYYDLLGDRYLFFRLNSKGLILLEQYNPVNEIFQFQNIIAAKKTLAGALHPFLF